VTIAEQRAAAGPQLHPAAWLVWLAALSCSALLVSNPLYLALAALVCAAVYASAYDTPKGRALLPLVLMGLAFAALSVPFNMLTGSAGETALMTLPLWQAPGWLGSVTFGGDLTLEALLTTLSTALTVATLVLAAAAFNASVDHFRLLRLAPGALAPLSLTLSVATVVLTQSMEQTRLVAEAQRLRGKPARGLKALPGLVLPTIGRALDRSIQRAESLDARGLAGGGQASNIDMAIGVAGLGLSAAGAFAVFYYGSGPLPITAMIAGASVVALALLRGGGRQRTRFRPDVWTLSDSIVAGSATAGLVLVLAMRAGDFGGATYLPYPEASAPVFDLVGCMAFLLLIAPALPALLRAPLGAQH
jgi:energy-coupling factor transport system permease protein